MKRVRFRIDLSPTCQIGPGKIALLEAIRESGSLSSAARALGMSYRRAWELLDSLNHSFRGPVASASIGGPGGGGMQLTALGRSLIGEYRSLEKEIESLAARHLAGLSRKARRIAKDTTSPPLPSGGVTGSVKRRSSGSTPP